MCGIFGYHGPRPPQSQLLSAAAAAAGRRGPHGCGWAVRDAGGLLRLAHHAGPLSGQLKAISGLSGQTILGHARLATIGDWRKLDQLQPIEFAEYALAHNGVIRNPDDLAVGHATDSIALAHAYAALRQNGTAPAQALVDLVARADQHAWAIVVLDTDGRLYAHRRYHPLWRLTSGLGVYLSSQQFHPEAELLPEDTPILV